MCYHAFSWTMNFSIMLASYGDDHAAKGPPFLPMKPYVRLHGVVDGQGRDKQSCGNHNQRSPKRS